MDKQDLFLSNWIRISQQQQEVIARELLSNLPAGFEFIRIFPYKLGEQQHSVAVYQWNLFAFNLIPGGTVALGYDSQSINLSVEQRQSWNEETVNYYVDENIEIFLKNRLSPLREINIAPFLLQAIPIKLGPTPSTNFLTSDAIITQEKVKSVVEKEGFRLPTSDEWEYACSGGARTLFRWGNSCPLDAGPATICDWHLHQRPNAFGLSIAFDPSLLEFCDDFGILRGGDGGQAESAGAGAFAEWLPLATSFQYHYEYPLRNALFRRLVSLMI